MAAYLDSRRPLIARISSTGFWSSGTHLASSERVSGSGLEVADMPEFMVNPLLTAPTISLC